MNNEEKIDINSLFQNVSVRTVFDSVTLLKTKYQIHWYRKKLLTRAFAKIKQTDATFNWEEPKNIKTVYDLCARFDKNLTGRLVFSTGDYLQSTGAHVLSDKTFQIWNGETSELLLSNNKLFKSTFGYAQLNERQVINTLKGTFPLTALDELYLLPESDSFFEEKSKAVKDRKFCFTGASLIRRETLAYLVTVFGGIVQTAPSSKTNYLVTPVNNASINGLKMQKIKELSKTEKGQKIEIINELDFIKLLPPLDDSIDLI